jgi:hypothetical protein
MQLRKKVFNLCNEEFKKNNNLEHLQFFVNEQGLKLFKEYEDKAFLMSLQLF